jgi:hypothetical protein
METAEKSREKSGKKFYYHDLTTMVKKEIAEKQKLGEYSIYMKIKREIISCKELNNFSNYMKSFGYDVDSYCFKDCDHTLRANWIKKTGSETISVTVSEPNYVS